MSSGKNDIDIFYELADQLEAKRILDIGMLLKRMGRITRNCAERKPADDICLHGIDFSSGIHFRAWDNVYDRILDVPLFLESKEKMQYDCAILLRSGELMKNREFIDVVKKSCHYSRYLLCDQLLNLWAESQQQTTVLRLEEDTYYLIRCALSV